MWQSRHNRTLFSQKLGERAEGLFAKSSANAAQNARKKQERVSVENVWQRPKSIPWTSLGFPLFPGFTY